MNKLNKLIKNALLPVLGVALSLMLFSTKASASCGMVAGFSYKISGYSVSFTDTSKSSGTKITNWAWGFGDTTS